MSTKERLEELLTQTFAPHTIEVIDQSAQHAGHAGALESGGGHFTVIIVSNLFEKMSRLKRHKAVYASIDPLLSDGSIHALSIKAMTPSEIEQ